MYTNDVFRLLNPVFLALLATLWPFAALAHPAEQGLVLLLPTAFYNWGGTLAVVASIVLISLASHQAVQRLYQPRAMGRGFTGHRLSTATSLCATAVFFALIYIGFEGPTDPQRNLLPLMIWTGWWVGLFVVQGLLADLWKWINPWTGLCALAFGKGDPILRLPAWLGAWPAVVVFLGFQMFLHADIAPSDPGRLATAALGYWVFTFVGMGLFGSLAWGRQVECFSVLFDLIGSLRMVQISDKIRFGLPGWQSLTRAPLDPARAVFCLVILISGSFDGLSETFWWLGTIGINPLEFPGRSAVVGPTIVGLLGANILIVGIFAAAVWGGLALLRLIRGTKVSFGIAFNTFAITILPIALGYHFAHYFVSFLIQIQYLTAAIGDPFARGANILNLGSVKVTTGFLNATETVKPILLAKVGMVVVSHIVSIAMAHTLAGRFAKNRLDLGALQLFLCILMIFYTFFGLWLLSTPRGA